MPVETLLDLAKKNGNDQVVGLIDETIKTHPELSLVPMRTIKGLNYKTLVRTSLPTMAFRNANEGVNVSKATYENRLVESYTLTARWECDKTIADHYEDGPDAYIAMEADAQMQAAMNLLSKQFYYGALNGGDAKGHPGLIDSYDAANMTIDAGGTTASTASSVWLVRFGPQNVTWVYGKDGDLSLSDLMTETLRDANNKAYPGYVQWLNAYPGLQVGSTQSVARIKKLTTDTGKGLTDKLISDALATFPANVVPDVIFMTRRSRGQLQASRSNITLFSGAGGKPSGSVENYGQLPTEAFGVPIVTTDGLLNTESLAL